MAAFYYYYGYSYYSGGVALWQVAAVSPLLRFAVDLCVVVASERETVDLRGAASRDKHQKPNKNQNHTKKLALGAMYTGFGGWSARALLFCRLVSTESTGTWAVKIKKLNVQISTSLLQQTTMHRCGNELRNRRMGDSGMRIICVAICARTTV